MHLDRDTKTMAADWRSELRRGSPYFTVSYQKPSVNLPEIETLVYLGSTWTEDDESREAFMFQTAESYQLDGDWSELSDAQRHELAERAAVMFYDNSSVGMVADIDGLLVLLNGLRERMLLGLSWDEYPPKKG